ncbi:MAG TPA: DUF6049 family protein [Jatrophihabitans sp.]|nr:DUF6049 family protein [Jatrophihabitans sp.]
MRIRAPGRPRGARALGAAVLALAIAGTAAPPPAGAAAAESDTVVMAITSVSPSTPKATVKPAPLSVDISLTNTTGVAVRKVQIRAERGEPIFAQSALDTALAHPEPPATPGLEIKATHPVTVNLPPGATVETTFTTVTSTQDLSRTNGKGICLCFKGSIYPLFFSAHVTGRDGVDQVLGVVSTFLPSFYAKPAPVHVSWIWPLIDRPHLLADETVFTDDDLTTLLAPDGRLSRALAVVEGVGRAVPLTLVIDPELLYELEVMATGNYRYQTGTTTTAGTGQAVATSWLDRLRAVLIGDPNVQVELTPYADPDVESLSRHGLDWSAAIPEEMSANVTKALAGRAPASDVAWPAAGAIGPNALDRLVTGGASTVVLNASAVNPKPPAGAVPAGIARLEAGNQDVAAILLSPSLQKYSAAAVTLGDAGAAALPDLVAELAVRAVQEPTEEHVAVIAAPRYVDPSVPDAVRAIRETSASSFAQPAPLHSVMSATLLPTGRSRLAKVPASAATLPALNIQAASAVGSASATLRSLFGTAPNAAARAFLTSLPIAVQRVESSSWRTDAHYGNPAAGESFAQELDAIVHSISTGVHIVSPSSGTYTLASSNSKLPITVENDLDYTVNVRVQVTTVNGLPGFTAQDIGAQAIDPHSKRILHLPTQVERSGRIQVKAQLQTPDRHPLGAPVPLSVHSTALGVIGVVITIVAGVVLALALLVRLARRWRHRRRSGRPARPGGKVGGHPEQGAGARTPEARPADAEPAAGPAT